jgi:hypothetical protein
MFLHNYAIQYLAHRKFDPEFWKSAGQLNAIKPKYVAYLEGIDYQTKLLEDTQCSDSDLSGNKSKLKITLKGLFADYDLKKKNYQGQIPKDQTINLVMDKQLCKLYGKAAEILH